MAEDRNRTPQDAGRNVPSDDPHDPGHEHEETVRKGYDAAQDPERQGDGDPGPDRNPQKAGTPDSGGRNESQTS